MAIDPEELLPKKKVADAVVGQDISAFSEFELLARIEVLEGEITRCRQAITERQATRAAADSVFRK